jgi:SAM-dependent methyltransferase
VGFAVFSTAAAPGVLENLQQRGIDRGLVVELGCGSGLLAQELDHHGYDVLGVDLSPVLIAIARRRVPGADFFVGSFLNTEIPSCQAVVSIGECFNYLFDESNSLAELRRLFQRLFAALDPGGLLIFDVAVPGRACGTHRKHSQGEDWAVLVDIEEDGINHQLRRQITTFRRVGGTYRRREEVHLLRLYEKAALIKELREAGFRVQTLSTYGQFPLPAGCVGFRARKP